MIRLGIIGQPVAHSLSPLIHAWLGRKTGHQLTYTILETSPDELPMRVKQLRTENYAGINVTSPLKTAIVPLVQRLDGSANRLQSVNTVRFETDGAITATNTDEQGFSHQLGCVECGHIAILGAGGVVPSVLSALSQRNIKRVDVFNRRMPRHSALNSMFRQYSWLEFHDYAAFCEHVQDYDLVIHCLPKTAQSTVRKLPLHDLKPSVRILDLNYGAAAIDFRSTIDELGLPYEDGRVMHCAQAFAAFQYWTQVQLDPLILVKLIQEIDEIAST